MSREKQRAPHLYEPHPAAATAAAALTRTLLAAIAGQPRPLTALAVQELEVLMQREIESALAGAESAGRRRPLLCPGCGGVLAVRDGRALTVIRDVRLRQTVTLESLCCGEEVVWRPQSMG